MTADIASKRTPGPRGLSQRDLQGEPRCLCDCHVVPSESTSDLLAAVEALPGRPMGSISGTPPDPGYVSRAAVRALIGSRSVSTSREPTGHPRTATGRKVVAIHGSAFLDDVLGIEAEASRDDEAYAAGRLAGFEEGMEATSREAGLDAETLSAFARLIGDVNRVIALDRGDRGGEWNTALASLDYSVDIAGAEYARLAATSPAEHTGDEGG